jgi:hypothetical protein
VTPALGLLLTTCALAADPAADKEPSARAEATLQRVAKLPPDYQQVWLRLLEQRSGWSALLTMKPEDAQRERERVAKILHQKNVAWSDLLALMRQLDQREKAAVSRMVRVYRTQVYENFRQRGTELVDRQEAWYRIWSAWEKAGSPPEQQDRLMDWLADAIKASSKDSLRPLPADPKFGRDVELVPAALVQRLREEQSRQRVAQSPPPRREEGNVPVPEFPVHGQLPLRVPNPEWDIRRANTAGNDILARRSQTSPPAAVAHVPSVRLPRLRNPSTLVGLDPLEVTALPAPPRYAAKLAVDFKATGEIGRAEEVVAKSGQHSATPQAISGMRPPSELPPLRAIAPPAEPSVAGLAPAAPLPAAVSPRETPGATPETSREPAPRADVLAMLPHKLLQSTVTEPERPALRTVLRQPLGTDTPKLDTTAPDGHAQVNVDELRTRIEGINLSLRTLEGELNDKRELSPDQLNGLLSRLDILVLRQRDLALFRNLITPREQATVGQIDSSQSAVATLGTRIAEVRTRLRQNESLSEKERAAALKQLNDFSDRLATLTSEK